MAKLNSWIVKASHLSSQTSRGCTSRWPGFADFAFLKRSQSSFEISSVPLNNGNNSVMPCFSIGNLASHSHQNFEPRRFCLSGLIALQYAVFAVVDQTNLLVCRHCRQQHLLTKVWVLLEDRPLRSPHWISSVYSAFTAGGIFLLG